jgi:hypothetical protein
MNRVVAAILSIFTVGLVLAPSVGAVDLFNRCTSADTSQCKIVKENNLNYQGKNIIWTIMQFVLGILGGIAVIMIVVGGIKFVISNGDASAVASAKKTILYSVVGLVVALLASGIVLLVNNFFG